MSPTVDTEIIQVIQDKEEEITHKPDPVAKGPTAVVKKHQGENLDGHIISEITSREKNITNGERLKGGPTSTAQSMLAKDSNKNSTTGKGDILPAVSSADDENTKVISNQEDGKLDSNRSMVVLLTSFQETISNLKKESLRHFTDLEKALEQKVIDLKGDHQAKLDSNTISAILCAEKEITGKKVPIKGGPTAQAQKHVGEAIDSNTMHAVTEGEKLITGCDDVVKGGPTAILQQKLAQCEL